MKKCIILILILTLVNVGISSQIRVNNELIPDTCNFYKDTEKNHYYFYYNNLKMPISNDVYSRYCNKYCLLVIETYVNNFGDVEYYIVSEYDLDVIVMDIKYIMSCYENILKKQYEKYEKGDTVDIMEMYDDLDRSYIHYQVYPIYKNYKTRYDEK